MALLTFELITPQGVKFHREVFEILLPTPLGTIGILLHHMPLVTIISPGVISIKHHPDEREDEFEHLATSGGIAEIHGKRVRLLADSAERAEEIDELIAQEAARHARELMRTAKDHVAFADATRLLERHLAQLKVTKLRTRKRTQSL